MVKGTIQYRFCRDPQTRFLAILVLINLHAKKDAWRRSDTYHLVRLSPSHKSIKSWVDSKVLLKYDNLKYSQYFYQLAYSYTYIDPFLLFIACNLA